MKEVVENIGLIGMVISFFLIIYSMFRRNDLTKRYVIFIILFFLLFGFGSSLNDGLYGIYEFISTAGFVLCIMFIWLIIHALIQKTGKALRYLILAILAFIVLIVAHELAEGLTEALPVL